MAKRFEKLQIEVLRKGFEESEHLNKAKKVQLSQLTGLDMEQVASWFNRMRARKRSRQSTAELKRINAELKKSLQMYHNREAKLAMELEQSMKRQAQIEKENQSLKDRLAIAEGDLLLNF